MTTCDIFSIVSKILSINTPEDVNGLYSLSQTNKEMNKVVHFNSDYDILKKIARFPNLCEAVSDSINNAINASTNEASVIDVDDATKISFENTDNIIPYITKQNLVDINAKICILYLDWDDTSIPRKYRDRCLVEGKILCDFIKKIDNNYDIHVVLPFSINEDVFKEYNDGFNIWLRML